MTTHTQKALESAASAVLSAGGFIVKNILPVLKLDPHGVGGLIYAAACLLREGYSAVQEKSAPTPTP